MSHLIPVPRILRSPLGVAVLVLGAAILALAVFAPILWGERAGHVDAAAALEGPSAQHWLGTDALGRDLLYRLLVATRLSLLLAIAATLIGVVGGGALGLAPVVLPQRVARLWTSVIDITVAFPGLLLALAFSVIFGTGTAAAVLALGLAFAPNFARLTYTLAAGVSGRDYVAAAQANGISRFRILARHILPNIAEPLVVNATVGAGSVLLAFAGLSFLGVGVQPPQYDWGLLLNQGLNRIYSQPLVAIAPGVLVVVAGLAFNLLGELIAAKLGIRAELLPGRKDPRPTPATAAEVADNEDQPALAVNNLSVALPSRSGWLRPVRGVSFSIRRGEAVGLVGESGSGKSMTALALSLLAPEQSGVTADQIMFDGTDLATLSGRASRRRLGGALAMVFQDPMTSFNPTQSIGQQLAEVSIEHGGLGRRAARQRAVERLKAVRIPAAERRAAQYPHELSGGMRQRAMMALGIMGEPRLIVADEPTTALDVTMQAQVLGLLAQIRQDTGAALLFISHDINLVRNNCDTIMVMYAGRIVEVIPADMIRTHAQHPYTRALLEAVPDLATDRDLPLTVIPGAPPELDRLPPGCAFADRCPNAREHCRVEDPVLAQADAVGASGHAVACWYPTRTVAGGIV